MATEIEHPGSDDEPLFPAAPYIRELTPVIRPNGKVYQPIKRPAAIEVEDYSDDIQIWVLRTHDIDRAYALAIRLGLGDVHRDSAHQTWIRDTFRGGRRVFDTDAVHGCPAVTFEVT